MSQLAWQKSTFSEPGSDTCVEVALDSAGRLCLRESATPGNVIVTTSTALGDLLRAVADGATGAVRR
ncbi:DUF397 domain-containing protein [Streptomyces sp. TRM68367]|uniref:DUF397 domain-containing protein n=1 Tax=Streptomyces sp. TRM68367 TaxID=2758415 RepID=UPI00165A3409|nr:DUF397 domain-containing protein [Streptomyces sp. TRM68367]MBC9726940.1 DUF397 domain-containing protein [Streptomyces sp. TRM68367]